MLDPADDLVLLFTALSAAADAEVRRRVEAAGFTGLRQAHGYLFQHLIPGPARISELAAKLGMTPQGVSKTVTELARLGYARRSVDEGDQRGRVVELTERGLGAIEAARTARADLRAHYQEVLGPAAAEAVLTGLRRLAVETGALAELTARRLRPIHGT
ncbi:MarR family transcriptional regulator [Crossiella sp. CA-258035]|uniref:MarR family winged helix-turn-helix transcriptional regulator n=1 Tax=Crossiella sp. CA-258035 TaxID=2981138 RepID=UPI0024BD1166|nr:MarR family transcriptional regulator [Crossiella sp. CA-258035]WHT20702.1 MarR family transcriptional regulator [Crossiella sp. CA-258035]